MKCKKIMILGGGKNQIPLIEAAEKLEYYVVVCDERGDIQGKQLCDKFIHINYTDKELVLQAARKEKIDGIISNSEPAMLTVAYVSENLRLPGNSTSSIQKLLSKEKFRNLQKEAGVFAPFYRGAETPEELLEAVGEMSFPVIIKPAESSGSRGTTRLDNFDREKILEAFEKCREFSRNSRVAAEEFVKMDSLIVNEADIFVLGNEILWDGIMSTGRAAETPMLPMTYNFPARISEDNLYKLKNTVEKILKQANITHGIYNVESYFTEDQVFVIEINPRQGGNFIPKLIQEHTGIDMYKLLVSASVNDLSYYNSLKSYKRKNEFITLQTVFAKQKGSYKGLYIDQEISDYVQWTQELYKYNDFIEKGENASNVVAYADLKFGTCEEQSFFIRNIEKYIYAIVQ